MAKKGLPKVLERGVDRDLIHYRSHSTDEGETLCGITDWLGEHKDCGQDSTKPISCRICRSIVNYIHNHRKPNVND